MCLYGLLSPVSNCLQRGRIREGLTSLQRADDHQNEDNYVIPIPISQGPRNQAMLSVPPSTTMNITQFSKMSLVVLTTQHPRAISGCGFRATGRKVSALPGTGTEQKNMKNRRNTHAESPGETFLQLSHWGFG